MKVEQLLHPREGDEELSEQNDKDSTGPGAAKSKLRRKRKQESASRSRVGNVGKALRSVYDSTLREDVPNDFIELLGKLS